MEYYGIFKERGLTPLENIKRSKDKIKCEDNEGFRYYLSPDLVKDKRTKSFDRWNKTNPLL